MTEKKITLSLWHELTNAELRQRSDDLAEHTLLYGQIEREKKAATAAFTERLESENLTCLILSREIRERGLLEQTECMVQFHTPVVGTKRIVRLDTGDIVKDEAMDGNECQEHLFEEKEAARPVVMKAKA